VAQIYN